MSDFPAIGPIPLPAPVWLLKALHIVTLSLHFMVVWTFLGGLAFAILWSILGRGRPGGQYSNASAALAKQLPVVMTYVINFGVPPLLFLQVLYGRAIYTSSVLMGPWWISIILALMACYWILYKFADRAAEGRTAWHLGLIALALALFLSRLMSTNMTLMLRPETWTSLYSASAHGTALPQDDPTLNPRWVLMLLASALVGGLWMVYLSNRRAFDPDLKRFFIRAGSITVVIAAPLVSLSAWWAFTAQTGEIQGSLSASPVYRIAALAGVGILALCFALGAFWSRRKSPARFHSLAAILLALLMSVSLNVCRDGVRDLSLASKGLDVWQSPINTNWSVVGIFLVLFVASIGIVGWLAAVVAQAKPIEERIPA